MTALRSQSPILAALTAALSIFCHQSNAQNLAPVSGNPSQAQAVASGASLNIDLSSTTGSNFSDPDVERAVRMVSTFGTMEFALFESQMPITVANFLSYVNGGRFNGLGTSGTGNTFFHRSPGTGFVVQAGGFYVEDDGTYGNVPTDPPIVLETSATSPSNLTGTLAMARATSPNTAASGFYINTSDNTSLDYASAASPGYAAFGRILGTAISVANQIDNLPAPDFSTTNTAFGNIPINDINGDFIAQFETDLVELTSVQEVYPLTFTASISDTSLATVSITGSNTLNITGPAGASGTATVTVTATDLEGASTVDTFPLTVGSPSSAPAPILNLSTRGRVGIGDDVLIGGIIIGGTGTKQVLITGRGPSIAIAGNLSNPKITIFSGSTPIASSDDWASEPNAAAIAATSVGGPASGLDAAVLLNLSPGAYTAIVEGVGGAQGIGIVEFYDLDPTGTASLQNVSTRGAIGTGDDVLIGGVIIGGSAPSDVRIVFRGRGPSLPTSVAGRLADPTLTIFNASGTPIATVDDWATGSSAGDLGGPYSTYAPGNPSGSALIRDLNPGAYTAILQGVGGTTGVGIVELFIVD